MLWNLGKRKLPGDMTDPHDETSPDPSGGDADGDGGEPDARECGGDA